MIQMRRQMNCVHPGQEEDRYQLLYILPAVFLQLVCDLLHLFFGNLLFAKQYSGGSSAKCFPEVYDCQYSVVV